MLKQSISYFINTLLEKAKKWDIVKYTLFLQIHMKSIYLLILGWSSSRKGMYSSIAYSYSYIEQINFLP